MNSMSVKESVKSKLKQSRKHSTSSLYSSYDTDEDSLCVTASSSKVNSSSLPSKCLTYEQTFSVLTTLLILFLTIMSFKRVGMAWQDLDLNNFRNQILIGAYFIFVAMLLVNLFLLLNAFSSYSKRYREKFIRRHLTSRYTIFTHFSCVVGAKIIFHLLLEIYLDSSLPRKVCPIFVSYCDMTLLNIFLNQLREKNISSKSEKDLNKCLGFNYLIWVDRFFISNFQVSFFTGILVVNRSIFSYLYSDSTELDT